MMQRLLAGLLVAFAFAGVAAAQQVYKWVDQKGVTHYGSAAPSGRKAQVVDATPTGYVHVIGRAKEGESVPSDRLQEPRFTKEETAVRAWLPVPGLAVTTQQLANEQTAVLQRAAAPRARGMSLDTFRRLSVDMSEGEVLVRAGPPDYESNQFLSSGYLGKTWYYYPTLSDPFTTTIQIQGGTVFSLDRVRQF